MMNELEEHTDCSEAKAEKDQFSEFTNSLNKEQLTVLKQKVESNDPEMMKILDELFNDNREDPESDQKVLTVHSR